MSSITSKATIEHLRTIFAQHGLPETIVSDNGRSFVSEEFEDFLTAHGIVHILSSPYHPATNGLAEKAVQIFKNGLKKIKTGSLSDRLAKVLFNYRLTPHTTTGFSPAELLLGRKLRSRLDLLRPSLARKIRSKLVSQGRQHDTHSKYRSFQPGDLVYTKGFGRHDSWMPGIIVGQTGPVSYTVQLEGREMVWRRHVDHIMKRFRSGEMQSDSQIGSRNKETLIETPSSSGERETTRVTQQPARIVQSCINKEPERIEVGEETNPSPEYKESADNGSPVSEARYPSRVRRAPERLTY